MGSIGPPLQMIGRWSGCLVALLMFCRRARFILRVFERPDEQAVQEEKKEADGGYFKCEARQTDCLCRDASPVRKVCLSVCCLDVHGVRDLR